MISSPRGRLCHLCLFDLVNVTRSRIINVTRLHHQRLLQVGIERIIALLETSTGSLLSLPLQNVKLWGKKVLHLTMNCSKVTDHGVKSGEHSGTARTGLTALTELYQLLLIMLRAVVVVKFGSALKIFLRTKTTNKIFANHREVNLRIKAIVNLFRENLHAVTQ